MFVERSDEGNKFSFELEKWSCGRVSYNVAFYERDAEVPGTHRNISARKSKSSFAVNLGMTRAQKSSYFPVPDDKMFSVFRSVHENGGVFALKPLDVRGEGTARGRDKKHETEGIVSAHVDLIELHLVGSFKGFVMLLKNCFVDGHVVFPIEKGKLRNERKVAGIGNVFVQRSPS